MRNRLYNIYKGMRSRCYNPNRKAFRYYGGKGVTICQEWLQSFPAFKAWALANGYGDALEIDRIDPDGNYCPENCRWVTEAENTAHRNARYLTVDGETKQLSQWTEDERCTVKRWGLRRRLKQGMTVEEAITTPHIRHSGLDHQSSNHIAAFGETKNLEQWAADPRCRVSYSTLQRRLLAGCNPEEALTRRFRKPKTHLPGTGS